MRSPSATTTSGPDAVTISVLRAWMGGVSFEARCGAAAEAIGQFIDLTDQQVGREVIARAGLWEDFREWLASCPVLTEVLRQGSSQLSEALPRPESYYSETLQDAARQHFVQTLATEAGRAAKRSGWWRENYREIKGLQRRLKSARGILES